ncbi:MAG: ATP-binding protein, partial [Anaerolineales bacterium]|nr:ATP-binding protein [Anaerolineales bacterium]
RMTQDGKLRLTQWDIRELQKAKGAILAAIHILMDELGLAADQLQKIILTGSFGGQVDIDAVISIGMIPAVDRDIVETIANGAGLGAAMFLSDDGFQLGEHLAERAEQVDLDANLNFQQQFVDALALVKRV